MKYEEIKELQSKGVRTLEMVEAAISINETSLAFLLADGMPLSSEVETSVFPVIFNDGYTGRIKVTYQKLEGSETLARAVSATGGMSQYVITGELFSLKSENYNGVYKHQEWLDHFR